MSSKRSRAALDTPERAFERITAPITAPIRALIKAPFSESLRPKQLAMDESYE